MYYVWFTLIYNKQKIRPWAIKLMVQSVNPTIHDTAPHKN